MEIGWLSKEISEEMPGNSRYVPEDQFRLSPLEMPGNNVSGPRPVNPSNFWNHVSYLRQGNQRDAAILDMIIQPLQTEFQSNARNVSSYNNTQETPSTKYSGMHCVDYQSTNVAGPAGPRQHSNGTNNDDFQDLICPSCGHNLGNIHSICTARNYNNNNNTGGCSEDHEDGEWQWIPKQKPPKSPWQFSPLCPPSSPPLIQRQQQLSKNQVQEHQSSIFYEMGSTPYYSQFNHQQPYPATNNQSKPPFRTRNPSINNNCNNGETTNRSERFKDAATPKTRPTQEIKIGPCGPRINNNNSNNNNNDISAACCDEKDETNENKPKTQNSRTFLWDHNIVGNMRNCWERYLQIKACGVQSGDYNEDTVQQDQKYLKSKSYDNDCDTNFWKPAKTKAVPNKFSGVAQNLACSCRGACRNKNYAESEYERQKDQNNCFHNSLNRFQTAQSFCSDLSDNARTTKSRNVKRSFLEIKDDFEAAAVDFLKRQQEIRERNNYNYYYEKRNCDEIFSKSSEISSDEKVEMWMERNNSLSSDYFDCASLRRNGSTKDRQKESTFSKNADSNSRKSRDKEVDFNTSEIAMVKGGKKNCDSEPSGGKPTPNFKSRTACRSGQNRSGPEVVTVSVQTRTGTGSGICDHQKLEEKDRRTSSDDLTVSSLSSSPLSNSSPSNSSQGPPVPPLEEELKAESESCPWSNWFHNSTLA